MALSRSARITLLLIIDLCFFFVELIVGAFTHLKRSSSPSALGTLIPSTRVCRGLARTCGRQLSYAQVRGLRSAAPEAPPANGLPSAVMS